MRETAKESCWKRVFIGLGANLGNKEINLKTAVNFLKKVKGFRVIKIAPLYSSAPWGYREQEWFLNTVLEAETALPPRELLSILLHIEKKMGRVRGKQWGPRIIDLDLLIYDNLIINEPDLVIPHPYLAERPFVLAPLADLNPDLLIPGYGRVAELMNKLGGHELEKLS